MPSVRANYVALEPPGPPPSPICVGNQWAARGRRELRACDFHGLSNDFNIIIYII